MWPNPQKTADLVTFIEEILQRKLHFLCSEYHNYEGSYYCFVLVVAKERYITRLDADMVIIRGQLAEKDALMVDIVRLIDSDILTKLDGVKRQLEVGQLQKQPSQMFYKKAALKNFAIFTGNHLCWSLFLIKLKALRPATLLKRDSNAGVFLLIL